MRVLPRLGLAIGAAVLTVGVLSGLALADDGGLMQRMMGPDAYMAMVGQMRAVLGNQRTDAMLASCETMMVSNAGSTPMMPGMGHMVGGQ